jgi:hypothetical protein
MRAKMHRRLRLAIRTVGRVLTEALGGLLALLIIILLALVVVFPFLLFFLVVLPVALLLICVLALTETGFTPPQAAGL